MSMVSAAWLTTPSTMGASVSTKTAAPRQARAALRRAVELRILEPEDLPSIVRTEPSQVLECLGFDPSVRAALLKLVEPQSRPPVQSARIGEAGGGEIGQTFVGEGLSAAESQTFAGEAAAQSQTFAGEAAAQSQTFAGEAAAAVGQTFEGAIEPVAAPDLAYGDLGDTLVCELPGHGAPGDTLDGGLERPARTQDSTGVTGHGGDDDLGLDDHTLDPDVQGGQTLWDRQLSVLEPGERQALAWAAMVRVARSLGLACDDELPLELVDEPEERVVTRGVLTEQQGRTVRRLRLITRRACLSCMQLVLPELLLRDPCPECGRSWSGLVSGAQRRPRFASSGRCPQEGERFGDFELLELVAEGGMGRVFKAEQDLPKRIVALKVLRRAGDCSDQQRGRFLMEAEAAACLRHPGIVPVHEVGECDGVPYYTMPLVEGLPLNRYRKTWDERELASVMSLVVDAVHYFHQHGIVHRDLKPDNVLVTAEGEPRIIDFGIAKKLSEDASHSATVEGQLLGTLHYMSPEQAAGRISEIDTRSDVYAAGIILYELVSGAPPFADMRQGQLLLAIQEEEPEPIGKVVPGLDPDLALIIHKAIAKDVEERYQTAADLAEDLRRFHQSLPLQARPPSLAYRLRKAVRRRPLPFAVATAVCGCLALASVYLGHQRWEREQHVADLIRRGSDTRLEWTLREEALLRAQALDPDSVEAQRGLLEVRRQQADARYQERQQRRELQLSLERERAQREVETLLAAQRAQEQAQHEERARAVALATALLAESAEAADLAATRLLSKALFVAPADDPSLQTQVQQALLEVYLRLLDEAIASGQVGLGEHWLDAAAQLSLEADPRLTASADRLARLRDGRATLERARALVANQRWVDAREHYALAVHHGVSRESLEDELTLLASRCRALASAEFDACQRLMHAGRLDAALERVRRGLALDPAQPLGANLHTQVERALTRSARRAAIPAALGAERGGDIERLTQALQSVRDPGLRALLERERRARSWIWAHECAGLITVPEREDRSGGGFYLQRHEVTHQAFAAFVEAGGYRQSGWFDARGQALLETFRDGCTEPCDHRGPRSWRGGTYAAGAALRPVTGITVHEARAYARWLSAQLGGRWRLPTLDEWELAAGWGPHETRRAYPWGDAFDPARLHSGSASPIDADAAPPNYLGLRGLGGNACEWVEAPGRPATKGTDYSASRTHAAHFAQVQRTGHPAASPSDALIVRLGFRLLREWDQ